MQRAPPRGTGRGFTLIEISVVLVIVGILAGVVTLSIANRPLAERQHLQAERLQQLLKLAAGQAQLQSTQIGLLVGNDAYRFLYLDDKRQWVPYTDGSLRMRKLPPPFELRLHIDQRAITAKRLTPSSSSNSSDSSDSSASGDTGDGDKKSQLTPQILLLSSGETTAFQLDLVAPGHALAYRISADALGNIELKQETLR